MHNSLSGFLRKWTRHIDTAGSASAHATDLLAAAGGQWQEKKKRTATLSNDGSIIEQVSAHKHTKEQSKKQESSQSSSRPMAKMMLKYDNNDLWVTIENGLAEKKSVGEKYEMMILTGEEQSRVTKSEMMVSHFFASLETENCLKK